MLIVNFILPVYGEQVKSLYNTYLSNLLVISYIPG
jgi:hypothetical protein